MIYLLVFYWIVAGFTFYSVPSQKIDRQFLLFIVCLMIGGVCIPVMALKKIIR